jgi:hypothetical protein
MRQTVQEQLKSVGVAVEEPIPSIAKTIEDSNTHVVPVDPSRARVMKAAGYSHGEICVALGMTAGELSRCLQVTKLGSMRKSLAKDGMDAYKHFVRVLKARGLSIAEIAAQMRLTEGQVLQYLQV